MDWWITRKALIHPAKIKANSMKMKLLVVALLLFTFNIYANNIDTFKGMFHNFAEKRDMTQFDRYYAKDFVLTSNAKKYNRATYKSLEANIYKTLKSLEVIKYKSIFSCGNKVVSRMVIKLVKKGGESHQFLVFIIAKIDHNKISRIWEVTYPSWSDKLKQKKIP